MILFFLCGGDMEELKNNKYYKICLWGFIIVTVIHVLYATITMRGMYLDGSFFFIQLLNSFAQNHFTIVYDTGHPRYLVWVLTQFPVILANFVLYIHNKYILMMLYTFTQLALPLILIYAQYKLSCRTKRLDLFFWSLFSYCVLMLPFNIFLLVETPIVAILIFILINYLIAEMEYTKADIALISFMVLGLAVSTEFFMFVGAMIFIASFFYASKEEQLRNIFIKLFIGIGSLFASIFIFIYVMMVPDESNEVLRFAGEALDFFPYLFNLCSIFSVAAVISLAVMFFKKDKITSVIFSIILGINMLLMIKLLCSFGYSLSPVDEGHFRTIPFWAIPLIVMGIFIFEFYKGKINEVKFQNYLCVVLICGIFQSCWQIVNTYHWDKNLKYMKQELLNCTEPLYLPFEHDEISSFFNPQLRRYIWYSVYTPTSILFSDPKKKAILLTGYEEESPDGNLSLREKLYVVPNKNNAIFIPMGAEISIKNRYWNLIDAAKALDTYNKEHNIKTER